MPAHQSQPAIIEINGFTQLNPACVYVCVFLPGSFRGTGAIRFKIEETSLTQYY